MPISYFIQKLFYFPFRWLFKFLLRLETRGAENYENMCGPLIIAANHKDYLDGIALVVSLPYKSKLFPIRFMVWHKIYYAPILHFLLKITGGFPISKEIGLNLNEKLTVPVTILREKGIIAIFPEGRMIKENNLGEGRNGAAFLALKTNTPIMPVAIKGILGASFKNFFLRRNQVKIIVGKPFYLPSLLSYDNPNDLISGSQIVMDKIKEFYYDNIK